MSISTIQNELNSVEKEIATTEKKKAAADKMISDYEARIISVRNSISKNTSASLVSSKMKQIDGYQRDKSKKLDESSKLGAHIANLREKRVSIMKKLQKAEEDERKSQTMSTKRMQQVYEKKIRELTEALNNTVNEESKIIGTGASEEYDVFISHAWEDKEAFVDEFVAELEAIGIKPWYDRQRIKWGDSMRQRIDEGLRHSKFGIVVISPDYIADGKYWTKTELDGLFQLESVNGKTILPIWHNITKKEVINYSSIVAGRLAMTTAQMTPKEIAAEMKKLLDENESGI